MVRGTKIQKWLIKRKNSFYTYLSKQNKVLALVEWPKSTSLGFQSEVYPYLLIYIYIYIYRERNKPFYDFHLSRKTNEWSKKFIKN